MFATGCWEDSMDTQPFEERIQEIDAYIELLEALNRQSQTGPPEIGGSVITAQQQKMLFASVYLQLYNLVEATATWCVTAVAKATADGNSWSPGQLDTTIRREWVRTSARTHVILNQDNRFESAWAFCELLLQNQPVVEWEIEKGGGGNWDVAAIEAISERIGCTLNITPSVATAVKRHFRDDKNALAFVKDLRNKLAHGAISFEQSGENVTVTDLKELKQRTVDYLRQVVQSFKQYVNDGCYLDATLRPVGGA
ncbi:hypothetical protein Pla100_28150 [Neorhodopirellula pilleata]|uniref:MAE-28990/MAE-18760-like HEPN domain-containing protein n=2 Tax=Neorhodopirellula pilleata TaxID=2714738 RepID=A0A5C6AAK2_9BACT|nr:hypothetical protein Pla100_28150 [Neorhodopirellula pilleata]